METKITANRATVYCYCRAVGAENTSPSEAAAEARAAVADDAVVECEASVIKDATPSVTISMAVRDCEAGDGDNGSEIFTHAEGVIAVDRQISGTGAVDAHVMVNLKFAAGQQDGAGDASRINRVAVLGNGERLAQRAWATVCSVCDYDDGSWQGIALPHQSFASAELGHALLNSASLRSRKGCRADG